MYYIPCMTWVGLVGFGWARGFEVSVVMMMMMMTCLVY